MVLSFFRSKINVQVWWAVSRNKLDHSEKKYGLPL
jgi:hypothetical protein